MIPAPDQRYRTGGFCKLRQHPVQQVLGRGPGVLVKSGASLRLIKQLCGEGSAGGGHGYPGSSPLLVVWGPCAVGPTCRGEGAAGSAEEVTEPSPRGAGSVLPGHQPRPLLATSEGDGAGKTLITIFSPVHVVNCSCRFMVPINWASKIRGTQVKPQTEDISYVLSLPWRLPIPDTPWSGSVLPPEEGIRDAGVCPRRGTLGGLPAPSPIASHTSPSLVPPSLPHCCLPLLPHDQPCRGQAFPRPFQGLILALSGGTALQEPPRAAPLLQTRLRSHPGGGPSLMLGAQGVRPVFAAAP